MNWQILTGISVITFSISILLRRVLLHGDKSDPIAYVIVFQGLVGVLTGVYALFHGFHIPDIGKYWFVMFATIALYAAGHVVSAKALRLVEASVFSVLFATSAIWTMLVGAFLFNDKLSPIQLVGVILIFLSVVLLVENKKSLKLDKGILYGLACSALFGVATALWAYVGRKSDVPSWTTISFLGPALLVLAARPNAVKKMRPLINGDVFKRIVLLGAIFSLSALTSLLAYSKGNVNVVAALQQTGIIITTILGIIFLNERKRLTLKAVTAIICFIGVLMVIR